MGDPSATEVRETLRQLRATTQHFKRTTSGLTDAQLRRSPDTDSWSVHEVLAHLRGCADVQGGWIARMLADDAPTIRYASPRTGMRKTDYAGQGFRAFFGGFARQRTDLVKTLSSLAPARTGPAARHSRGRRRAGRKPSSPSRADSLRTNRGTSSR